MSQVLCQKIKKRRTHQKLDQFRECDSINDLSDSISDLFEAGCSICFTDEIDRYRLSNCNHRLCFQCLQNTLTDQLEKEKKKCNKKVQRKTLDCPVDKCRCKLELVTVIELLMAQPPKKMIDQVVQTEFGCRKCKRQKSFICGDCMLIELEECAKVNFFSKQQKFEDLIVQEMETEQYQQFFGELEQLDLVCPVCKEFIQYPLVICPLGHETCRDCLYNIRQTEDINQVCPLCKYDLLPIAPEAQRTKQVISKLKIQCPKCKLELVYPDFIGKHIIECIEPKIECQYCQRTVEARFYEIHIANYCVERQCPFQCDKLMKNHENGFYDHLLQSLKRSDIAITFNLRLSVLDKFLFHGSFGICNTCEEQYSWRLENRGQNSNQEFCFKCFKLT